MRRRIIVVVAGLAALAQLRVGEAAAAEPAQVYQPLGHMETEYVTIETPASLRNRLEAVSTFPLDRDDTSLDSNFFFMPVVRIGTRAVTRKQDWPVHLAFEYEHDLVTGTQNGAPPNSIGDRLPNGVKTHDELRRFLLRATVPQYYLVVQGGYTTSNWGMGMLANDGAHGWTPGSAYFGDPRSGDRVIRALLGTLPLTDYDLVFHAAYDDVVGDEYLLDNDSAYQVIGSATIGQGKPHWGGIYIVYRSQDDNQGGGFNVVAYDATASTTWSLNDLGTFTLAAEFAALDGTTTFGPTVDFPKHDILSFGTTVRASLDRGNHGFVFDFLFATGDENFDDKDQNLFKVDPNYEFGLVLFRQVMAAQTGRAVVTAKSPDIIGRPPPDLDRIPTGGSPSNTAAFFPRGWYRPWDGLEVYGGPLFAISDVRYTDPFNTSINGGQPHNALGGNPGSFYGTELDLGTRYRRYVRGVELTAGLEVGMLITGNAFTNQTGGTMGDVWDGRFMVEARL